jgi:non-heme chloroperoxidase
MDYPIQRPRFDRNLNPIQMEASASQPRQITFRKPFARDFSLIFKDDPAALAAAEARDVAYAVPQAKAFESAVPSAHMVRLVRANHYVFMSNEADVLREMRAFISSLP